MATESPTCRPSDTQPYVGMFDYFIENDSDYTLIVDNEMAAAAIVAIIKNSQNVKIYDNGNGLQDKYTPFLTQALQEHVANGKELCYVHKGKASQEYALHQTLLRLQGENSAPGLKLRKADTIFSEQLRSVCGEEMSFVIGDDMRIYIDKHETKTEDNKSLIILNSKPAVRPISGQFKHSFDRLTHKNKRLRAQIV